MEFLKMFAVYLAGLGTIIIGDYIWLWNVAKSFTIREFWNLVSVTDGSIDIKLGVGLTAWAIIAGLVYVSVIHSGLASSYGSALWYGAIIGFLSYAMYDLTNLTFLKWYSTLFTVVDVLWGTFLCAMIALAMFSTKKYLWL